MIKGVITKGIGGFYTVSSDNAAYVCRARGKLRKQEITPAVGDRVLAEIDHVKNEGTIEEVLPRKNYLVRPAVANIDILMIVVAAKDPEPELLLVDKLIICCERMNIQPILVINKCDIATETEIKNISSVYQTTDYPMFTVSGKVGIGIEALQGALTKGIIAIAGQSGVGKSSIINMLNPGIDFKVGEISKKIARGKHTTRHAELISMPTGAMMVDTPGFSTLELSSINPSELQQYYPDFIPLSDDCRFRNCMHLQEPGCAVKKRVDEGLIDSGRYERYTKMMIEIKGKWRNYDD